MKYLSILIITLASVLACSSQMDQTPTEPYLNINEDYVQVIFDTNITQDQLDEIPIKLAEVNITLEYETIEFRKNGKLKEIAFKVDCNDGFSGSASQTFILKSLRTGFYRDYREGATATFGSGTPKDLNE